MAQWLGDFSTLAEGAHFEYFFVSKQDSTAVMPQSCKPNSQGANEQMEGMMYAYFKPSTMDIHIYILLYIICILYYIHIYYYMYIYIHTVYIYIYMYTYSIHRYAYPTNRSSLRLSNLNMAATRCSA